jgi:hypothetical protein
MRIMKAAIIPNLENYPAKLDSLSYKAVVFSSSSNEISTLPFLLLFSPTAQTTALPEP